ncbi:GIM3 Prefoldin subunit 4 [Candida maltosa Xu316]|uniref:Prefoldin subunit 4 n=1 Tax=Candida maltosa (strain Xu316) TaxID=1245528 RepID=M3JVW2_CANMX|nr:hypothetical protein G210_2670 [Candida maltosa Xu316]
MELLPEGQKNTSVEVTREDQNKINKFSTIIFKKDEIVSKLDSLKTEKEYLDDLSIELELLDEDEEIMYKVGDSFVYLKVSSVIERIENDMETLSGQINEIGDLVDEYDEELNGLKVQLYDKFGKNINLER